MTDPRPRIWETVFLQFVGSQGVDKAAEIADTAVTARDKRFASMPKNGLSIEEFNQRIGLSVEIV